MADYKLNYTAEEINERLGAVLPVVELSEETFTAIASGTSGEMHPMTASETQFFLGVSAANTPCIMKIAAQGMAVSSVGYVGINSNYEPVFKFDCGAWFFLVNLSGGTAKIGQFAITM